LLRLAVISIPLLLILSGCVANRATGFTSASISPDSSQLAVGNETEVLVFDSQTHTQLHRFRFDAGDDATRLQRQAADRHGIGDTLLFIDDRRLASTGMGGMVSIYDTGSGRISLRIPMPTEYDNPTALAWSEASSRLAVGTRRGAVYVFAIDQDEAEQVGYVNAHSKVVEDLLFSADGTYLATIGEGETTKVWLTRNMSKVGRISVMSLIEDMELLEEGSVIVAGNDLEIWAFESRDKLEEFDRPSTGKDREQTEELVVSTLVLAAFSGWLMGPAFALTSPVVPRHCNRVLAVSPKEPWVAAASPLSTEVPVVDIEKDEVVVMLESISPTCSLAFSPDGLSLLVAASSKVFHFDTTTWARREVKIP
jgi:WD40 repeat protein